ncbi:MAG: glycosyltransferase family 4 protein [Bdellovibrio sp.]|nr:glycosyltransferase family 4 protein [Bdellovibrio sp.]
MIKIIQILPYRFWGGPEIQSFQLARQLAQEGFAKIDFIFYYSPACSADDLNLLKRKANEYEVKLEILTSPSIFQLLKARQHLARKIINYQVLVSSGYLCDLIAVGQSGIKTVSMVHGWTAQNFKIKLYENIDRFLLRFFNGVGCVSVQQIHYLTRKNIKAFLVSNCLDLEKPQANKSRVELLKFLNIQEPVKLILTVGRLSAEKGQQVALDAFSRLNADENNVHWIFIGDGPDLTTLQTTAEKLKLTRHTHFLGKLDLASDWMAECDLFVLPSYREGLPVVILEAISKKLPVIATDVGGNRELIQNEVTGLLVLPGQAQELSEKIQWGLQHSIDMKQMAEKAYGRLKDHFTLQKQSQLFQELINHVKS